MGLVEQITRIERRKKPILIAGRTGQRSTEIVRTSFVGIIANVVLVAIKIIIGSIAHSVAIVSDGVNNLADAFSSILVVGGTYLAGRKPNRKHPFGYGRIEYVVTVIIGALVIAAGAATLRDAIEHIINPRPTAYSIPLIIVLMCALVLKLAIGLYFRRRGRQLNAETLTAAGKDALMDTLVSAATIVAAFVTMVWGVSIEAFLAIAISALILKTGLGILLNAVSQILGQRVTAETAATVKDAAESVPEVLRVCNMRLTDFGPEHVRGSLCVEIDERLSMADVDQISQAVQMAVFLQCGAFIDAVGIYPVNCTDPEIVAMRERVSEIVASHKDLVDMHAFRIKPGSNLVMFDVIATFDAEDDEALCEQVAREAEAEFPAYHFLVTADSDVAGH